MRFIRLCFIHSSVVGIQRIPAIGATHQRKLWRSSGHDNTTISHAPKETKGNSKILVPLLAKSNNIATSSSDSLNTYVVFAWSSPGIAMFGNRLDSDIHNNNISSKGLQKQQVDEQSTANTYDAETRRCAAA